MRCSTAALWILHECNSQLLLLAAHRQSCSVVLLLRVSCPVCILLCPARVVCCLSVAVRCTHSSRHHCTCTTRPLPSCRLLERYQPLGCTFNDDIQGTACITLAGILSALRAVNKPLQEQRVLFFGAGEAGTGIGELIAQALVKQARDAGSTMSIQEARQHCWFLDSKGLICAERADAQAGRLAHHKVPFAHAGVGPLPGLLSAVQTLKPTILIGVSTIHHAFTQQVVEAMSQLNEHPIIFPLSNPTCKSECSYEEAMQWSNGSVLFASGSPFQPLCFNGEECHPSQVCVCVYARVRTACSASAATPGVWASYCHCSNTACLVMLGLLQLSYLSSRTCCVLGLLPWLPSTTLVRSCLSCSKSTTNHTVKQLGKGVNLNLSTRKALSHCCLLHSRTCAATHTGQQCLHLPRCGPRRRHHQGPHHPQ